VINSGHTRGQGVVRCTDPDKNFCPKAIGMVGRKLPADDAGSVHHCRTAPAEDE
jgi:hypothetical protein